MIPTPRQCFELMDRYGMPEHIRAHCVMVTRVALLLGRGLRRTGIKVSVRKAGAGALMHDIGKTLCLREGGDHAAVGREICRRHGMDEIADIVGEHVRLRNGNPYALVSEKEIVYYADKRVNHDRVVTLEQRLYYILRRYGRNDRICRAIRENFTFCAGLEAKLFKPLSFMASDLPKLLSGSEQAHIANDQEEW